MEYELYHYGVKGMKWGVRRYRNKGGSYTKKGLENFDKSAERYDAAKKKLKDARASSDKVVKSNARSDLRIAKAQVKKDYKQIKKDRRADQGKEFYRMGKTISGNSKANAIAQVGIVMGSKIVNRMLSTMTDQRVANIASASVAVGGTVVNAIIAGKTAYENNRLRAYYAHGRN